MHRGIDTQTHTQEHRDAYTHKYGNKYIDTKRLICAFRYTQKDTHGNRDTSTHKCKGM